MLGPSPPVSMAQERLSVARPRWEQIYAVAWYLEAFLRIFTGIGGICSPMDPRLGSGACTWYLSAFLPIFANIADIYPSRGLQSNSGRRAGQVLGGAVEI